MARIARSVEGIARAALLDTIAVRVAQGDTFDSVQALLCTDAASEGMAAATRDAYGGRRIGAILDAMVKAQKGRCLLCTEHFWKVYDDCDSPESSGTVPNVFLLIPSQLFRDSEVSGYAAHESGWVPGNMIAACTLCTNKRDRATEAMGEAVCVMADNLTQRQQECILLTFPKSVKASAINHDAAMVAKRNAIRIQSLGF